VSTIASFLQNNSWLPGVVVALALFGFTLYFRRRDKDAKHLDYQIISDTPIVTSRDRPEILKVMYGANEVSNPYITEIRFKNTGNQVIEPDDFLEPMTISRKGAKVLDFNDVNQSERKLVDHMDYVIDPPSDTNPVEVTAYTLNTGDWFTIQVIYDVKHKEGLTVTGRIKGQTRRPQSYQDRTPLSALSRFLIAAGIICIAVGVYVLIRSPQPFQNGKQLIATVLIAIGSAVYGAIVFTRFFERTLAGFRTR
jgi:hypothetical protein